jgi:hypothetical protein
MSAYLHHKNLRSLFARKRGLIHWPVAPAVDLETIQLIKACPSSCLISTLNVIELMKKAERCSLNAKLLPVNQGPVEVLRQSALKYAKWLSWFFEEDPPEKLTRRFFHV